MVWTPGAEKRTHPRKAKKFLVKYSIIGGTDSGDSGEKVGQVLNFSRTGIYMVARKKLPMGAILEIKIPENVFTGGARTVKGVVRRVDVDTPWGTPTGLMFVKAPKTGSPSAGKPKSGKDKRRHPRKPQNFIVRFRCVAPENLDYIAQRQGRLMNISQGGMELWTRRHYPKGADLEISIPKNPMGPARKILAKVVWSRHDGKLNWHHLGLTIVESPAPA